jgi:hypothetical protein
MPEEVRLWSIGGDRLAELNRGRLDFEQRLEDWLARDIAILDAGLLVIGRQVQTDFGGYLDLLCLNAHGDLVVVELKRDKTPREIVAQVLDYGSWVRDLSNDRITALADVYLGGGKLEEEFSRRFRTELPETLNEDHRLLIVGSSIDSSSERIVRYLSGSHGVNINVATFQYFRRDDGSELLARIFLIEPEEVELQSRVKGSSKRRPNLTTAELETIADERGVGDLYRKAVLLFERHFQRHTTRSSLVFTANVDGRRRAIVSLIPAESSPVDGLRFQVYSSRWAFATQLEPSAAIQYLPPHREEWQYTSSSTGGEDWTGFQGFIGNEEELRRFSSGLER